MKIYQNDINREKVEQTYHKPVLLHEVVKALHIKKGAQYIDATLGAGGHTIEILKMGGHVLGIDADPGMIEIARRQIEAACPVRKENFSDSFKAVLGNFKDVDKIARDEGFSQVTGVIFDLGVSSVHFDDLTRGFSFKNPEAPLDMRLDRKSQAVLAADLLNTLREDQLLELFSTSFDFGVSRGLAKKIIKIREGKPFAKVSDLLSAVSFLKKTGNIHPATKVFMALRIAVNTELMNIAETLPKAFKLLVPGGVLAVISFHSGEDRIVKNFFREREKESLGKAQDRIVPSKEEILRNSRARSAVLRVFIKNEKKTFNRNSETGEKI